MTSGILSALSAIGFCLFFACAISVFGMFAYLIDSLEKDKLNIKTRVFLLAGIGFFMFLGATGLGMCLYSQNTDQKYIACLNTLPDHQLCEYPLGGKK